MMILVAPNSDLSPRIMAEDINCLIYMDKSCHLKFIMLLPTNP